MRRATRSPSFACLLAVSCALLTGPDGDASASAASGEQSASCPVTIPRAVPRGGGGSQEAGFGPAAFNYGDARLRAHLYWPRGRLPAGLLPDGGVYATVDADGSISAKLGWWRGIRGRLVVRGRRLDAPAPPLHAHVSSGYGPTGFQPSGLSFPTVGCWRVVGRVGNAQLVFVVRVVKLP